MKIHNFFLLIIAAFSLSACHTKNNDYDATGIFEATEIIISAKGNGEIMQFDIEEGLDVKAQFPLGFIDTTQLYLKKIQLQSSIMAINNRQVNVSNQIAVLKQQIETQKQEQKRFEQLVKQNVANQKQLDDINAQIAMLEKQLVAQIEALNNSNNSLNDEQNSLVAQIAQIDDQIKNSIIKSPIDGTILGKYAQAGEFTVQGRALFKIADMNNVFLRAYITANQLTAIKTGRQVKVYSDMGKSNKKEYTGTITWISDKAEFTPKTIQTQDERSNLVYAVKISVKNDGYIKKGMYGEAKFN
ncbi:MAG: HlyD family efflux transporter periplasmic adaptor subunit [Bacteroidales bacterium]|jgi:HlyD family secretion protein|nr:HlyD family efflux transporter periplasmic adaptor subunit [Bacteroidales bacterium]